MKSNVLILGKSVRRTNCMLNESDKRWKLSKKGFFIDAALFDITARVTRHSYRILGQKNHMKNFSTCFIPQK
jgi:hypothetical protein